MKRSILVLLVTATLAGAASAQIGFRNISSVSVDYYFDGAIANDVNQVFLLTFLDWLAAEFKIQREDTATIHETRGAVAPIFIVPPYYFIVRYGIGYGSEADPDSDPQISHEATIDANLETASYLANITFRASFYPGGYYFFIPSVGGKFITPIGLGVMARYFYSYNSYGASSHAVLSELDYPVSDAVSIKAGGSATFNLGETEPPMEFTVIAGISFTFVPGLTLRYHFEYLGRQLRKDGIRNILVLDARF